MSSGFTCWKLTDRENRPILTLWSKIAGTSAATIYNVIVGIAFMFVTARILGPDGRGVLVTVVAWMSLFAMLAGLSLGQVSQHRIQLKSKKEWIRNALGALTILALVLSAVASVIVLVLYWVTEVQLIKGVPASVAVLGLLLLPFLIWKDYSSHLLMATGQTRTYNVALIFGSSLGLGALLILLLGFQFGVHGALLAEITTIAAIAIISLKGLWRYSNGQIRVKRGEVIGLLQGAMKLHLNTIGAFFLIQTNVLMLAHFSTPRDVGLYQLGYQMVAAMLILPQVASKILYSRLAELGPDQTWPQQRRLIVQMMAGLALVSMVAYLLAPWVVRYLAGPEFAPSAEVFRYLLPALFGMSLAQLMDPAMGWTGHLRAGFRFDRFWCGDEWLPELLLHPRVRNDGLSLVATDRLSWAGGRCADHLRHLVRGKEQEFEAAATRYVLEPR